MAVSVADSMMRLLLFEVGSHLIAAEARHVREVIEPSPATPVPGAPPAVLGLINVRGTLMTATELGPALGIESKVEAEASLIVCEREDRRLALLVDRLVGVEPYPKEGLDLDAEVMKALGVDGAVAGVGEYEGRPYYLLEMGAIFDLVLGREE